MDLSPAISFFARTYDSLTISRATRGLATLEHGIEKEWHKLENSRTDVIRALSKDSSVEITTALQDVLGFAETALKDGQLIYADLKSSGWPRQRENIARELFTKVEKIRDEVIREGFPEICLPPRIDCAKVKGEHLGYGFEGSRAFIDVNPDIFFAPREVIKGGLAHEVAHLARDLRLNGKARAKNAKKYERSSHYRHDDEHATDLEAVKRGFGRSLLAFLDWIDRKGYIAHTGGGLKRRELRKLLNESDSID